MLVFKILLLFNHLQVLFCLVTLIRNVLKTIPTLLAIVGVPRLYVPFQVVASRHHVAMRALHFWSLFLLLLDGVLTVHVDVDLFRHFGVLVFVQINDYKLSASASLIKPCVCGLQVSGV